MRFKGIPRHARVILGTPRTTRGIVLPTKAALGGQPRKPQLDGLPVLRDRGTVAAAGFTPFAYLIQNSLRFRASNSTYLSRAWGTPTNNNIWTVCIAFKVGQLGTNRPLFGSWGSAGLTTQCYLDTSDRIRFFVSDASAVTKIDYVTNRVFRDPKAHYTLTLGFDNSLVTTLVSMEINLDAAENSFATSTNSAVQNANYSWNKSGLTHYIGAAPNTSGTLFAYFDGVISRPIVVDGQKLPASTFLEINPTSGQPVPKPYSGTYGAQGSICEFKDASAATAAAIGRDSSGNGNNWTPSGISVTAGSTFDQMTDTPTRNCATFNPIEQGASGLSAANLVVSGSVAAARSTIVVPSGRWVAEFTVTASGAGAADIGLFAPTIAGSSTTNRIAYRSDGSKVVDGVVTGGYGATFTTNDVIRVEVDTAGGTVTFFKNGTSQGALTYAALGYVFYASTAAAWTVAANFGQQPFAGTPTSGFNALQAGALAAPATAVLNPANGFKIVLNTATNIDASVTAARSAFPAYVDIKKDRDAATTWAWQFSHDAGNEHACGSTDTYQSKRSFSGANRVVGYSLAIGAAYGTAAGSVAHTNGAADTITHNLGNARCMIFLFPRAGGDVYVYHPDLTSGNLVRLNNIAAQAASTLITGIFANSFQVGSGAATGTYDYLVVAEKAGFSKLFSYPGNANTDGADVAIGFRPAATFAKNADSASGVWLAFDDQRSAFNAMNNNLYLDQAVAEDTVNIRYDYVATALKVRNSNISENGSANKIVGLAFARFPFNWSPAR